LERPSSEDQEALRGQVERGDLDAFLVLPAGITSGKSSAEFHTKNPGEITMTDSLGHAVSDAVIAQRLHERGLNVADVGKLVEGVDVKVIKMTAQGETEEKGQTLVTAMVVAFLLYTTLIIYGVTTMRAVIEEKSSRVMEILVASVRPFTLLSGKILGVASVGITQYAIWGVAGALVAAYGVTMVSMLRPGTSMPALHPLRLFICGHRRHGLERTGGPAGSDARDAAAYRRNFLLQYYFARSKLQARHHPFHDSLLCPDPYGAAHRLADSSVLADRALHRDLGVDDGGRGFCCRPYLPGRGADVRQAPVARGAGTLAEIHVA
jgi:hypothetical protein